MSNVDILEATRQVSIPAITHIWGIFIVVDGWCPCRISNAFVNVKLMHTHTKKPETAWRQSMFAHMYYPCDFHELLFQHPYIERISKKPNNFFIQWYYFYSTYYHFFMGTSDLNRTSHFFVYAYFLSHSFHLCQPLLALLHSQYGPQLHFFMVAPSYTQDGVISLSW